MSSDRLKRLFGTDLSGDFLKPLSEDANQPGQETIEIPGQYQLLCLLTEYLENKIRAFLEEVNKGEDRQLLESKDLFELVPELILIARYYRYDAECCKREAEKLGHLAQGLPQGIANMEKRLAKIKLERSVVLADLKGIKRRRRNKRRRR